MKLVSNRKHKRNLKTGIRHAALLVDPYTNTRDNGCTDLNAWREAKGLYEVSKAIQCSNTFNDLYKACVELNANHAKEVLQDKAYRSAGSVHS